MRVLFKTFENQFAGRSRVLQKAAEFAAELGPDRLINITHSQDHHDAIITVWYWEGERTPKQTPVVAGPAVRADAGRLPNPTADTERGRPQGLTETATDGADLEDAQRMTMPGRALPRKLVP
jgi:hypothetical protein